jgi:hypothetical protein
MVNEHGDQDEFASRTSKLHGIRQDGFTQSRFVEGHEDGGHGAILSAERMGEALYRWRRAEAFRTRVATTADTMVVAVMG